jgi:hypothetical protein
MGTKGGVKILQIPRHDHDPTHTEQTTLRFLLITIGVNLEHKAGQVIAEFEDRDLLMKIF